MRVRVQALQRVEENLTTAARPEACVPWTSARKASGSASGLTGVGAPPKPRRTRATSGNAACMMMSHAAANTAPHSFLPAAQSAAGKYYHDFLKLGRKGEEVLQRSATRGSSRSEGLPPADVRQARPSRRALVGGDLRAALDLVERRT